jgi:hypothetical protein
MQFPTAGRGSDDSGQHEHDDQRAQHGQEKDGDGEKDTVHKAVMTVGSDCPSPRGPARQGIPAAMHVKPHLAGPDRRQDEAPSLGLLVVVSFDFLDRI